MNFFKQRACANVINNLCSFFLRYISDQLLFLAPISSDETPIENSAQYLLFEERTFFVSHRKSIEYILFSNYFE